MGSENLGDVLKGLDEQLKVVNELLRNEKAVEARQLFEEIEVNENIEYLIVKGILEQKFQQWGKAHNSFSRVLEIDPENTEAFTRLQMIKGILNFFNPDQFNP